MQVRDETYRQFEEAAAEREQAEAAVSEANSARDQAAADLDRARVDVEAARADLVVAQAERAAGPGQRRLRPDQGPVRRRAHPAQRQPGRLPPARRRHPGRAALRARADRPGPRLRGRPRAGLLLRPRAGHRARSASRRCPGITREGKVVRSGFSLNPSTRTLQTEIDIPNSDGHLRPGWYVTVTIAIERKQVWALPSNAIAYQGGQNYYVYLDVDGKPVRTPVIIGPSDDTYTEVLRKYGPTANTNDWPNFDGTERVFAGNLDVLEAEAAAARGGRK